MCRLHLVFDYDSNHFSLPNHNMPFKGCNPCLTNCFKLQLLLIHWVEFNYTDKDGHQRNYREITLT